MQQNLIYKPQLRYIAPQIWQEPNSIFFYVFLVFFFNQEI